MKAAVVRPRQEQFGLAAGNNPDKGSEAWVARREDLRKNIPTHRCRLAASEKREEEALYRLGKIYRFDLKESEKAVTTFTRLLNEFPKTAYREEIYYLVYLSLEENNKNRPLWKEKLLAEFPNSSYARLLNQAALAGNKGTAHGSGSAAKTYETIYALSTRRETIRKHWPR